MKRASRRVPQNLRKSSRQNGGVSKDNASLSYCDLPLVAISVSTTQQLYKLDDPLFAVSQTLSTYPQTMTPTMSGQSGVMGFVGRIQFSRLQVKINCVGSQGNFVAAADLYNRIRVVAFWTKTQFSSVLSLNTMTVDSFLDRRDIDFLCFDKVIDLPCTAIGPTGVIAPGVKTIETNNYLQVPVTEAFSSNNGVNWDTRSGSFYLLVVSDSTTTPHPAISGETRLSYRILKR